MFKFKKVLCLVMSATLFLASASNDVFATEGEYDIIEEISDGSDELILSDAEEPEEVEISEDVEAVETDENLESTEAVDSLDEELSEEPELLEESELIPDEEIGDSDIEMLGEEILCDGIAEAGEVSDDRKLTEAEKAKKRQAAECLDYLGKAVEGKDYVAGEVYAVVDTAKEAEEIALAYDATLIEYECFVARFALPEGLRVFEAVSLGADADNNYPAVFPNLYATYDDTEEATVYSEDDINEIEEFAAQLMAEGDYDSGVADSSEDMELQSAIIDARAYDPYLNDASEHYQWYHDVIGSPYAWDYSWEQDSGIRGQDVKIALLANGVNSHEGFGEERIKFNYNATNNETDRAECLETGNKGAGTFMAGLIIGAIDSHGGIGVAPESDILNVKVDEGTGVAASDVVKGINAVLNLEKNSRPNIMIINIRFDYPDSNLEAAVNAAYNDGIAVFAPTAQNADNYNVWPASFKNVIAVGATNKSNLRTGYSGYGKVDLVAPGESIWSCNKDFPDDYIALSSTSAATAIAAGEAALILSYKSQLPSLNGKTGANLVNALKNLMAASTISAGKGAGKGIVYLPKALNLCTVTTAPTAPEIEWLDSGICQSDGEYFLKFKFNYSYFDIQDVYYTLDGKNPTFKNGAPSKNAKSYNANLAYFNGYVANENLRSFSKDTVTLKAIAVNSLGVTSKVAASTLSLKNQVCKVKVSGPDQVVPGKSIKLSADVVPANSLTKKLTWHISTDGTPDGEVLANATGLKVTSSGEVKASKGCTPGTYKVWAVSKATDGHPDSNQYEVTVAANSVKLLKAKEKKVVYHKTQTVDTDTPVTKYFNLVLADGTEVDMTNINEAKQYIYFTSSNKKIVEISDTEPYLKVKGPGTVTITAVAKDGSGQKASIKYTVYQNAVTAYISVNGYNNSVAQGKSLALKTVVIPSFASVKKFTDWKITKQGGGISNITIKNGKVITKKNTPAGKYDVTAKLVNYDGSVVNVSSTVRVIESPITKIVPEKKSTQVFRTINDFGSDVKTSMKLKITGGERNYGKPSTEAFEISLSNPNILKFDGISADDDGTITVGLLPMIRSYTGNRVGNGKVKVTVTALDGGNAKATFTVNVVNPVSSVKIGPAKAGVNMAVATGKTLQLKAMLGTGYGPISNNKVKWSVMPGYENDVMINQKGVLTPIRDHNEVYNGKKTVKIKAEALDGSEAYEVAAVDLYANVGAIRVCNSEGATKNIKASATVSASGANTTTFYVLINKRNYANGLELDDLMLSSSNPSVGTFKVLSSTYKYFDGNHYYIYRCEARGLKKGSTKFTIKTRDGSQSVSYKLTVNK